MSDDKKLVQDALQRATEGSEPDISRLIDGVPAMMAEARRRRQVASDPWVALETIVRAWIPRFAGLTAVPLLAALVLLAMPVGSQDTAYDSYAEGIDSLIITGEYESDGSFETDSLLEELISGEGGNG